MLWNNRRQNGRSVGSHKLYTASPLRHHNETKMFQSPLTSLYESGLSGTDLDLYGRHPWNCRWTGRIEIKFQGFTKVFQCSFFSIALARDVNLQTLGDVDFFFFPNTSRKLSLHRVVTAINIDYGHLTVNGYPPEVTSIRDPPSLLRPKTTARLP